MVVEMENRGEYCSRGTDRRGLKEAEAPPPAERGCTNERRTNGKRTNERTNEHTADRKRAGRRKFEHSTPSNQNRPIVEWGWRPFCEPRKTALPRDSEGGFCHRPRNPSNPLPSPRFVHALTLSLSSFSLPFTELRHPLAADVCVTHTYSPLSQPLLFP